MISIVARAEEALVSCHGDGDSALTHCPSVTGSRLSDIQYYILLNLNSITMTKNRGQKSSER